jgi:hypothetical protein
MGAGANVTVIVRSLSRLSAMFGMTSGDLE